MSYRRRTTLSAVMILGLCACNEDSPTESPDPGPLVGELRVRLISSGPTRDADGIELLLHREGDPGYAITFVYFPPGDSVDVVDTVDVGHYDGSAVGVAPECVLGGDSLEGVTVGANTPAALRLTLECDAN